jgi:hypothetical protein
MLHDVLTARIDPQATSDRTRFKKLGFWLQARANGRDFMSVFIKIKAFNTREEILEINRLLGF